MFYYYNYYYYCVNIAHPFADGYLFANGYYSDTDSENAANFVNE